MVYRPQYFWLTELVCKQVYNKYGDKAWLFLDDKAVVTLDWIRRTLNKPITINNWWDGGDYDQRGLRCNLCSIVKSKTEANQIYLSAHILGRAFDFDVDGMTAGEVRVWLATHKNQLPYNIRLENHIDWVHLDTEDTGVKVYIFNP
jgi:hypothetical protein